MSVTKYSYSGTKLLTPNEAVDTIERGNLAKPGVSVFIKFSPSGGFLGCPRNGSSGIFKDQAGIFRLDA